MRYLRQIILLALIFIIAACSKVPEIGDFESVAANGRFPEGAAWDHVNTLYVSNCYGDWITRIQGEVVDTFLTTAAWDFGTTNGMTVGKDGILYACDYKYGRILTFTHDGQAAVLCTGFEGQKFNRPNDLALWNNYLYFSDPHDYSRETGDGRLFRLNRKTGEPELLLDGLHFPNGLAFSPDGRSLFLCESALNRILKLKLDKEGRIVQTDVFVELPGGDPDGIAFDKKGNLYVAHFGSGTLFIISKTGEIIQKVSVPGRKPSNVEFAGADLKTLFITEDETNTVYRTRVNIAGVSLSK